MSMSAFAVARCALLSSVAAIVLASAVASGASAKNKPKARALTEESTVMEPARQSASPPVRYFTINQVLAKRGGQGSSSTPTLSTVGLGSAATSTLAAHPPNRPTGGAEPFGMVTFRAPEGLLWVKWRRVQEQIRGEAKVLGACREEADCSSSGGKKLASIIADAQKRDGRARIEVVNRLVNASIRYTSDFAQHGVADLWSPPLATLTAGRGDCEDYAIAKYVALREAGTAEANLRLVLVRDRTANQDHAVLAVRQDGSWLVLDNRHTVLNESTELVSFTPLFALDQGGVKLFAAPYVLATSKNNSLSNAAMPASEEAAARDARGADDTMAASVEDDSWRLRGGVAM